jgi:hypothetical protein
MPWSWARVSTGTSPKLRDCMDGDTRASKAEECIRTIVGDRGGEQVNVKFELNGEWALLLFHWQDPLVKHGIVRDLQARDVIDVIDARDMDALIGGDGSVP